MKAFFRWLMAFLTGCTHDYMTFPRKIDGVLRRVCIHCGTQFSFDWETMTTGAVIQPEPYVKLERKPTADVKVVEIQRQKRERKGR